MKKLSICTTMIIATSTQQLNARDSTQLIYCYWLCRDFIIYHHQNEKRSLKIKILTITTARAFEPLKLIYWLRNFFIQRDVKNSLIIANGPSSALARILFIIWGFMTCCQTSKPATERNYALPKFLARVTDDYREKYYRRSKKYYYDGSLKQIMKLIWRIITNLR